LILPSGDVPAFLIVAGPNGSGKSSVYEHADIELNGRTVWIVNPDILSRRIHLSEGVDYLQANREAVVRIERWLDSTIDVHKTVGVETVLSTDKYRRLVLKAKGRGYVVWLLYVLLDAPERNIERVRLRVLKGGHDVPEDKVRSRYVRSLDQLPWFLKHSDEAWIYDNSKSAPRRIGVKRDGLLTLSHDALPAVRAAIERIDVA
jgi:predicted ABC-type ATPase